MKAQSARVTVDVWDEASASAQSIQLQKFSASTWPPDVKAPEMPEEMRGEIDRTNVGKIWRARVGRTNCWCYAWRPDEAMAMALAEKGTR